MTELSKLCVIFSVFTDHVKGYDKLWFWGDNFVTSTYRNSFKNNTAELFIKDSFEYYAYCQSKYEHSDTNMLNRLRNALIQGINEQGKLPKVVVLVQDDDLLEFLNYGEQGMSSLVVSCIEWICKQFEALVKLAAEGLPPKAVKDGYPQLYYVAPPHHQHFKNNHSRSKLINVMEVTFKDFKDIRIIRMKEFWDYKDGSLVNSKGQFTDIGWETYWISIGAAVKFNLKKRELYLANQVRNNAKPEVKGGKRPFQRENKMK